MIELAPETLWLTRFCTQDEASMYILFQKGWRLPSIKELDQVRYFLGVHHVIIWTQETVNNSDFESMLHNKARVIPVRDVC
jgi:hypothetical protein